MKLGIPDDRDPEFTVYFTSGHIADLADISASPADLVVPPDLPSSLTIRVDFVSDIPLQFTR